MMKKALGTMLSAVITLSLLMSAGGMAFAAKRKPLTPELAAKVENHRRQQEQRVTQPQRETAAQSLKDQRLKVLKAKRDAKRSKQNNPHPIQ
ncbi:MAG: hypothetical protein PHF56_23975 [Desulfuromonadaceae bacterium]|nr:hypothetical protein [Desulfuromonadaceae bacterium]